MVWWKFLLVALGGAFGAMARYAVSSGMVRWLGARFPWGTFTVNLLGSFCMGFLFALAREQVLLDEKSKLILMVGFLGSFTTFSSFSLDNYALLQSHSSSTMLLNIVVQNTLGLLLVVLGIITARLFLPS